ncbi:MAG TPA: tripartite tricarboxylate transporter TctB family protein [Reyranella sp.]|nr:tripartite tricarboxylate transporter TctB family protein [Reyranella sp.]
MVGAARGWRVSPSAVFALVLAGLMLWVLVEAQRWPANAQLLPRAVSIFGLVMLAGYALDALVFARRGGVRRQIMDIGRLDTSAIDRRQVVSRLALMVGSTSVLVLAIWLVGFHAAIPVYVFVSLSAVGRTRWWTALLISVAFEALLIGVYDNVMHVTWHETLLAKISGRGG